MNDGQQDHRCRRHRGGAAHVFSGHLQCISLPSRAVIGHELFATGELAAFVLSPTQSQPVVEQPPCIPSSSPASTSTSSTCRATWCRSCRRSSRSAIVRSACIRAKSRSTSFLLGWHPGHSGRMRRRFAARRPQFSQLMKSNTLHLFLLQVVPDKVSAATFLLLVSKLRALAQPCAWQKAVATGLPQVSPPISVQA